jgi:hypothetical protein
MVNGIAVAIDVIAFTTVPELCGAVGSRIGGPAASPSLISVAWMKPSVAKPVRSAMGQGRDSMNFFDEDRIRIREQSWHAWDRQ